ncbi:DUF1275 family protein [Flectobacillus longus]|uniref:DUF1275 family protein n=1 Tax=Flectobacillus longus TaxID=2984207 RepID=UPI0024B63AB7|nr:DUF1275 family protein [Flectobacillus longus]MDI9878390.1 DUF1275 family protein [Flectobacillus longus]
MKLERLITIAIPFSIISGIMNILGIKLFGVVTTNVTGLFSLGVQWWSDNGHQFPLALTIYILSYLFGSFFSSWWYHSYQLVPKMWKKLITPSVNLSIVLFAYFMKEPFIPSLVFAMSNHNAFASNFTCAKVKPSQLTGLVMDLGVELSKLKFTSSESRRCLWDSILTRLTIIVFFTVGALIAVTNQTMGLMLVVVIFYLGVIASVVLRKF